MTFEQRIRQTKALPLEEKTDINLILTSSDLELHKRRTLKPFGISPQQFNILRILKGQKGNPVPLKLLSERMIDRTSNTSRLVDKLAKKGLVKRTTCPEDRRRVEITIEPQGLELVNAATKTISEDARTMHQHMTKEELMTLNRLLDKMRKYIIS